MIKKTFSEKEFVLEYFKKKKTGQFLEVGANDGNPFSHTEPCWGLVEKGWQGVYVEPNPFGCSKLIEHLTPFNLNKFKIFNCAIDKRIQLAKFFVSKSHPAVSSLQENWTDNLEQQHDFQKIEIFINTITFDQIFMSTGNNFNFISFDLECSDEILNYHINLIDWSSFKNLKLVCIEIVDYKKHVTPYLKSFGFKLLTRGNDNNIFYEKT